jgi:hypothetical protein
MATSATHTARNKHSNGTDVSMPTLSKGPFPYVGRPMTSHGWCHLAKYQIP